MNPWDFFPRKVCLTLGGPEWDKALHEFNSAGLYGIKKFQAIPSIGPHQSFNLSVKAILREFYESNDHSLLFLEDDCDFRNTGDLWPALTELPENWDIFYMGCNIREDQPQKVTNRIYRVKAAWTTHCIAYTKPVVKHILENAPGESEEMFDNWLSRAVLPEFNAYVMKPMVAYQRPRKSAIWNTFTDYTNIFKESEAKLI